MKLVAIARAPACLDEAARAVADAMGLALAEARMRLAPEPPALLARVGQDEANALVGTLRKAGLAALAVDTPCPTDKDRTVVHRFVLSSTSATFTPRLGSSIEVEWPEVMAVLRGTRASTSVVERTEKVKRFSPGNALITGGVVLTRASRQTVRSSEESQEQVILVYARDGRAAVLSEAHLDFACLGSDMKPSATGNMAELARLLRERASSAYHDDRLLRLGRRPLPFLAPAESRSQTPTMTTTHRDTTGSLDALAEVMRQAVSQRLLP